MAHKDVCDYGNCGDEAYHVCFICHRDLCSRHVIVLHFPLKQDADFCLDHEQDALKWLEKQIAG